MMNCSFLFAGDNTTTTLSPTDCEERFLAIVLSVGGLAVLMLAVIILWRRCHLQQSKQSHQEMSAEDIELAEQNSLYIKEGSEQLADIRLYREIIADRNLESQCGIAYMEEKKRELEKRMPGLFAPRSVSKEREAFVVKCDQLAEFLVSYPKTEPEMSALEVEAVRIARKEYHVGLMLGLMEEVCKEIDKVLGESEDGRAQLKLAV